MSNVTDDMFSHEDNSKEVHQKKEAHWDSQEIIDHTAREPAETIWIQLSDAKRLIRIESCCKRNPTDGEEKGHAENNGEPSKGGLRKQVNEAKVIEVTHTGLGTEHEYEQEVSEEHQHAGTEEALAFVQGCCPSERSHAQCNKEDEEKYCASARYQRKQIAGL